MRTFGVGKYVADLEVNADGKPAVALGEWAGDGQHGEVNHLLTISGAVLMQIGVPPAGMPVIISRDDHAVQFKADDMRRLRELYPAAEAMLASYQGWLAGQSPHAAAVPGMAQKRATLAPYEGITWAA